MENINPFEIYNFIADCNEFLDGKYLFANTKILHILEAAQQSKDLMELFTQCSEDFNYSLESTKSFIKTPTKPGYFQAPQELDKMLALVYCLLNDFKDEKINFNVFVSKYFSGDEKLPPHQKFGVEIIKPLKETVAKYFELDDKSTKTYSKAEIDAKNMELKEASEKAPEEVKQEQVKETSTETHDEEEDLKEQLKLLINEISAESKSLIFVIKNNQRIKPNVAQDAVFLISEIVIACESQDFERVYALLVGFRYLFKHLKNSKKEALNLLSLIDEFESF